MSASLTIICLSQHETVYKTPDASAIYSAATGDVGSPYYASVAAVTWLRSGLEVSAVVVKNGMGKFEATLYNFGGR